MTTRRAEGERSAGDAADPDPGSVDAVGLEGVITRFGADKGPPMVVNAVLKTDSGQTVALYMRGKESKGIVKPRDRVRIEKPARWEADGTLIASHLRNVTTDNSPFAVWNPPLRSRVAEVGGKAVVSLVIGPAIGFLVEAGMRSALSSSSSGARTRTAPGGGGGLAFTDRPPASSSHVAVAIIVGVAIALVIALLLFYRLHVVPRRRQRAALLAAAGEAPVEAAAEP